MSVSLIGTRYRLGKVTNPNSSEKL